MRSGSSRGAVCRRLLGVAMKTMSDRRVFTMTELFAVGLDALNDTRMTAEHTS